MRYRAMLLASGLAIAAIGAAPAKADVVITVDKSTQLMTVQVDGATRWQWKVSTGRTGHDTPNGTFHALYLDANHHSKKYDDAPMPHSVFFTDLGHAIHGTFATRRLGMPASHGCVRLDPDNATQLFSLVAKEGTRKTTIIITGNAADAVARAKIPTIPAAPAASAAPAARPASAVTAGTLRNRAADDLFAPVRLYPQPIAQPTYRQAFVMPNAQPPVAPPNYPPFPRPATVFGDFR